ncbi:MAG: methylcobamide--CoM methyltransferase [Mogibacterium sp.]|nr:methylcobamide--CoM methyltransferase [Mogibacterium sp.]
MAEIREYKCTYANSVGISSEVTARLGLTFPEAYLHSETMQILAKAVRDHDGADFCLLPFCRTVEAEAMGADINFGDANTGPRARDPICTSLQEILELPEIDPAKGRMADVLKAVSELKAAGETVALEITGPFTILNALMEPRLIFKAYRKDRAGMCRVFDRIGAELLCYIDAGKQAGADVFILSDSSGALEILGPKVLSNAVEDFYAPFLKQVSAKMDESCIFLLCPKFTFALLDTGHAEYRDHELEPGVDFLQALLQMKGQAKIAGQVCIKNTGVRLANGRFRELILTEAGQEA